MGTKYSLADANKILEEQFNKPNGRFYEAFNDPKKQKDAIEYLKTVINNLDTETLKNGSKIGTTVLYSGAIIPNGASTGEIISKPGLKNNSNLRVLDNTPAFDFLDFDGGEMQPRNESLKKALISIFGDTDFDRGTPANDFLFGEWKNGIRSPGAFDIISNNFAAGAKGSVIAIVPNANPKQVFGATELKALLQNQNVTYINGLDKNELLKILGDHVDWNNIDASKYEKIFNKIKAASVIQMTASGLSKFPNDTRALSKYLEYAGMDMVAFIKKYPKAAVEAIDNLGNEELKLVQKYLGMGTEFTSGKVGKFDKAKHIGKLGLLGLGLGLAFAVREAKAAEAAGDHERAKDIMAEWAVGEAGSEAASAASTVLTTLAGTALLGLSAPVAAVAGVAVGIVAGIYGEDMAKELYQLTKDLDNNGRRDIWDRLITAAVGQDFKPNEIPEMLKNKAVSLKPEMPLEELIAKAKTDIAYRYALRELNPFVAEGADYTSFNTDGTLDLWTPDNPNGMTEDYIRDRAYMVLLQMRYLKNGLKLARDLVDDLVQGDWDYMDHSRHPFRGDINRPLTFSVDGKGISVDDHRIVFGSNLSDNEDYDKVNLEGGGRDDRIYGLDGHDRLAGKGGSDHLEGGKGNDIYQFSTKDDGIDTIFDSDGNGSLEIDEENIGKQTFSGITDPELSKVGDIYYSNDKKYRMENMLDYWKFSVRNDAGNYKALAKIKPRTNEGKWNNGDLGITLKQGDTLQPDDFHLYDANASAYYYYNAASSPEGVRVRGSDTHSSQFNGSPYDDIFYTGNGVLHYVMGAGGNDYIAGGDGREYIMAGMHNKDKPLQNDEDTVFAGGNSDIVTGGDSNDQLHADDGSDNYEKPLPDESIQTEDEKRGDWISGQYGSDTITGSAKKDVLAGGEGDDTIRAGAGDDLVLGDANYVPSGMYKNISYTEKTIEIRWLSNGNTEEFQDTEVSVPSDAAFKWTWSHDDKDFSVKPGKGARMVATDRVQGAGNDTLHGGAGNDWMAGQAGNDEVHGDDGDDTIFGDDAVPIPEGFASGDDRLYAGKGKDKLHGGAGNDVLDASDDDNDKDELSGDEGDDQLNGGTGGDELNGGAGNDVLRAGKGKTLMDGGTGNDFFFSNDGDDTMTDQDGDDHYYISSGTDSIRDLGMGHDGYHISFAHLMPPGVTTIHDSNGKGFITYNGRAITNDGVRAVAENEWVTDTGAKLARDGSNLVITNGPKGSQGKVVFTGFFNSEEFLGLKLPPLHDDNKPSPEPKPDPKPQPPSPVRPVPDQPKAPTAGKPLAAQSIHEKDKLTYTLAEDTFHTTNKDDKLSWSARLADGKPLPKWLNFDAATRTFSGTPGNDDVGVLDIEISVQGKGGAASQHLALNVINVNDAPQIDAAIADYTGESGRPLQYRIPANAFKDIDKDDTLTLSAKLENGQPLPSWLSFDEKTGQFSGTPPSSHTANTWRIAVTATDKAGAQAGQTFSLMTTAAAANIIQGTGKESTIQGTAGNDIIYVGDNPLKGGNYKEIYGNDGDDVIYSGSGRDHIHGGAGNDILYAGGTEHDGLYGGYGDDIYRIGADFQEVSIKNYDLNQYDWRPQRHDVIEFAAHKRNDFNIYNYGDNLYLKTRDGKEVSIFDQFSNQGNNWHYINEIRFTDRTLTAADIKAMRLDGTVGNDTLTAKADGSWLYGKQGNDHLFSGKGNDYLDGGAGNDTYHFARGFGYDLINNYEAGLRHDAIVFSDMNISDFDIFRERTNLVLRSKDGKDQVVVRNHFNLYKGWQIDSIRFADGRVLDESAINALVSTQHAPQMNYVHPAAQALQMNQAIASLNSQAQPLDALATPDLQPRPLLAAGNP